MSGPGPGPGTSGQGTAELAADDVVYGVLRLAGMDVALPLAALREVAPCPVALTGIPASAPGLLGALELRSVVLPVIDLRPVLGCPAPREPDQVVVVVASGGQVLGLLADEVRGITRVPAGGTLPVRGEGELLLSHTFRHPETGAAVSVLDAGALLRRPGVPTVADATRSAPAVDGVEDRRRERGRMLTVVRCGSHRLAIDAEHVHTTLPAPDPRPSVLDGPLCPGVVEFADREVAVVDPLALLGLGALDGAPIGAGLVLDLGSGYVVLALTALLELTEVAARDVLPVPSFAVPRPELCAGLADVEGIGACLVLDGAALLADPELSSLAAVNTAIGGPTGGTSAGAEATVAVAVDAPRYLTYSVGMDVATRLERIVEIVPFPATVTATAVGGVLGMVVHRGAAVPVLCLASLLGLPSRPVTAASCLLLVSVDGAPVAFAVEALRGIDPLTWTDPEQRPRAGTGEPGATLRSAALVQLGDQSRLLPDLDLDAVARAFEAARADRPAAVVAAAVSAMVG